MHRNGQNICTATVMLGLGGAAVGTFCGFSVAWQAAKTTPKTAIYTKTVGLSLVFVFIPLLYSFLVNAVASSGNGVPPVAAWTADQLMGITGGWVSLCGGFMAKAWIQDSARQPRLFVGGVVCFVFLLAVALYGLELSLVMATKSKQLGDLDEHVAKGFLYGACCGFCGAAFAIAAWGTKILYFCITYPHLVMRLLPFVVISSLTGLGALIVCLIQTGTANGFFIAGTGFFTSSVLLACLSDNRNNMHLLEKGIVRALLAEIPALGGIMAKFGMASNGPSIYVGQASAVGPGEGSGPGTLLAAAIGAPPPPLLACAVLTAVAALCALLLRPRVPSNLSEPLVV